MKSNKPVSIIITLSSDTLSADDRSSWFDFLADHMRELYGSEDVQVRYDAGALRDRFVIDGRELAGGERVGFHQDVQAAWDNYCRGE